MATRTVETEDPVDTRSAKAPDAATRGKLTIAEKAIEKIAGQVASEIPGVSGSAGGFLGIGSHPEETARPRAKVELHGLIASIHLSVGIRYPTPLRSTTNALRRRVRDEVSARCGVDVRQVDIDINDLISESESTGRRELL